MCEVLIHDYRIPAPGVKRKVLYHFSDCHLTEYDDLSSQDEKVKALSQTAAWERVRKDFAVCYHEPYGTNQQLSPAAHFDHLLSACQDGDALLIAGDLVDYVSPANVRFAESRLEKITIPYLSLCGNHDLAKDLPDTGLMAKMKKPVQILDLGDLILLGLDDSQRLITHDQFTKTKEILSLGKAVIIALHIPIMTEENRPVLKKAGEYFRLNYDGCPKENLSFIDMISSSPHVIAVMAGHLHFLNVSPLTPHITQYVASQGITGNLNRYIIGE